MATTLIVPIDVAALCVGLPDTQGEAGPAENLAPMADFSTLPWVGDGGVHNLGPYVSAAALTNAEAFEGQVPLLQGIHVHWALPDGLTAGQAGDAGIAFPAAPNRWLVTRIVVSSPSGAAATTSLKSWVVESDRLSDAATAPAGLMQPNVPLPLAPGQQGFAYLGQAFDLETWSEQGDAVARLTPFTAVGYGEPTFAAFYPNSSTVFGHYDSLADLTAFDPATSTVTYHVAGWYANAADDPLQQPDATLATYGWSVSGDDVPPPTATMCAGAIDAIAWNPGTAYLGQTAGALTVSVGGSTPEALSALMASVLQTDDPGQYAGAEQVLNALQFGLLSGSQNTIDSLPAFEEAVHAAGFATLSAGPLWTVTAAATSGTSGATNEGSEVTLPTVQAAALNALNGLQLQANDAAFRIAALQFQLFVDWYKYQLVQHQPSSVPQALVGQGYAVQQYLQTEAATIQGLQSQLVGLNVGIDAAASTLGATLDPSLALTRQIGAPRYYQPVDPVLVLTGPDVTPVGRYGNDAGASGTLPCRTDAQLVSAAALAAGVVSGSAAATVAATALPALAAQPAGAPNALLQALAWEAFFLAGGLQPALAAAVAAEGGSANPALLDPSGTVAALVATAAAFLAGGAPQGVSYTGSAPDPIYDTAWTGTPWLPLLMQYEVEHFPVQYLDPSSGAASYATDFVDTSFAMDADTIDLQYVGAAPTQGQLYTGTAILTPNATVDLSTTIGTFLQSTGNDDPELAAVLAALDGLPVLSQGLTGLTDALLMRALTLQMPVGDPLLPPPLQTFLSTVADAVGGQNATAPLPENAFNPIRAGTLAINKLRLVDVFGRFRDYPSPSVLVARGLTPPSPLGLPAGQAFLPPRLTQPSRLLFRWRAASGRDVETNASPATTPVCGWVVPNYLDASLQLYAGDGTPLGALALSADETRVLWTPAPGGAFPIDAPLATVMTGQNADLAAFAQGVFNDGDATFAAPFFAAVREALTFALPARFRENAAQAVLLGQPLALARASLALDVAGPTATDESWTTFASAVLDKVAPTDAGLSAVQFPVVLGALTQLDDTLVGYWVAPSDADGYRTFYAPAATTSQGGVAPPTHGTLALTPQSGSGGSGAGTVDVVLLLDPRGVVHATTGVLPVKAIDIPPAQYTDALASLAVAFETTPVLSGSNVPALDMAPAPMVMVQPKVSAGAWTWVTTDGTTWVRTTLTDAATAAGTLAYTPQRISEGWLGLTGLSGQS